MHLSSPPYVLHAQAYIIILDLIIRTLFGEEYSSLSSLYGFPHSAVILSHLPQIPSSEPYSQTPSAYIPPTMTEHEKNRKIKLNSIVKFPLVCEILSAQSGTD